MRSIWFLILLGSLITYHCFTTVSGEATPKSTDASQPTFDQCKTYVDAALKTSSPTDEDSQEGTQEEPSAEEGEPPDSKEDDVDESEEDDENDSKTEDESQEDDDDTTAEANDDEEDSEEAEGTEENATAEDTEESNEDDDKTVEADDDTTGEDTTEEDTTAEDDATEEDATEEDTTAEDNATGEDATEEDPNATEEDSNATEEDATEEDATGEEDATEEDATGEDTTAEDATGEEDATEEDATTEDTTEEDDATEEDSNATEEDPNATEEDATNENDATEEDPNATEEDPNATEEDATNEDDATEEDATEEDATQEDQGTDEEGDSQEGDTKEDDASAEAGDSTEQQSAEEDGDSAEDDQKSEEDDQSTDGDTQEDSGEEKESDGSVPSDVADEADQSQSTESQEDEATQEDQDTTEDTGSPEAEDGVSDEQADEGSEEDEDGSEETDGDSEEEEEEEVEPYEPRSRDHITQILGLDDSEQTKNVFSLLGKVTQTTLKDLKSTYENAVKPLEQLYKYRDLSNRHFGDPEIFSKPLVVFMGPWSGGKSTIINWLLGIQHEDNALRTGADPSPAQFNIMMYGDEPEKLDGTQLAADWTFSGLQKFGQSFLDRLRGQKLPNRLLEKVNIVEIPGILEVRKQVERSFPFNDACQWFIDRADTLFLIYDPAKLDIGPETEAILDQLKGRENQVRIVLNKADTIKPDELLRVQAMLVWNISPLMSSAEPPIMYAASLWDRPLQPESPKSLLVSHENNFLKDIRDAVERRVETRIAAARRFAVRVRNHAKMVDCYLNTYNNHRSFFSDKKKVSNDIIDHPQNYHIYEGLSTLSNISRYDLPDPDSYKDFFRVNPLWDFPSLSSTCSFFKGCPLHKLDIAIAYDLPEILGKFRRQREAIITANSQQASSKN